MAERGGFEPPRRVNGLLAFQASPFSHLGTPPKRASYTIVTFLLRLASILLNPLQAAIHC